MRILWNHSALNGNAICLRDFLGLLLLGDHKGQDAIREIGLDVLLLGILAHIEAAADRPTEPLTANVAAIRVLLLIVLVDRGADRQVAVLQQRFTSSFFTPGRSMEIS